MLFCCRVPKAFGSSIPMKSTFFITYIMVDGWSTLAAEVLRFWPLVFYHMKNIMLVKTEKDREKAMPAMTPQYNAVLPHLGLYFLLGLVYAIISPLILPFIIVFFAFGYIIFRNQVNKLSYIFQSWFLGCLSSPFRSSPALFCWRHIDSFRE